MANSIKILNDLQKDENGLLYELEGDYFIDGVQIGIYKMILTDRHSGRPWLVSYDIFNGDTSKIDIICSANGILNPFTMNEGDEIFYPDPSNPDSSRATSGGLKKVISNLKAANAGKVKKIDPSRTKDSSKKTQREIAKKSTGSKIPIIPNLTDNNQNIQYSEGIIILKPNF